MSRATMLYVLTGRTSRGIAFPASGAAGDCFSECLPFTKSVTDHHGLLTYFVIILSLAGSRFHRMAWQAGVAACGNYLTVGGKY
jgi:hypothetical protein